MKFCFGPMSLNIIEVLKKFAKEQNIVLGLIPSRRQIDFNCGYVGNLNTQQFNTLVKDEPNIKLFRDHAGPYQGLITDYGVQSIKYDMNYFNYIHIDPFKKYQLLDEAAKYTAFIIRYCNFHNENMKFEVGTEKNIQEYTPLELSLFLKMLQADLGDLFNKIEYAVVQTGAQIQGLSNIDAWQDTFIDYINVCHQFNVKAKEHNGDFLSYQSLKKRFNLGVDCINIAPELGIWETKILLKHAKNKNEIIHYCIQSNKWIKWVPETANNIIKALFAGHYLFSDIEFMRLKYQTKEIDKIIQEELYQRIKKLYSNI